MGKAFGLLNGVAAGGSSAKTAGASLPFEEIPHGTLDGSNTVFTLTYTPDPQYLIILSLNGVLQDRHVPDFTVSGNTITYAVAPKPADQHFIIYWYTPASSRGRARQFGALGTASAVGTFLDESAFGTFAGTTMNDGDTVTVGSITYTFKTSINNTVANEIAANPSGLPLGPSIAEALWSALIGGYGAGTWYSTPTTANPDVGVSPISGTEIEVDALVGTAPDNPITLSSSAPTRFSWDHASISNGAMSPGDTITIGAQTYTFVATLNNAVANEVLAAPLVATVSAFDGRRYSARTVVHTVSQMLANAINGGPGSGTTYSSATVANADVSAASGYPPESVTVTAKAAGTSANSIALSATAGGRFNWSGSTLSGGTGGSTDVVAWGPDGTNPYHINGNLSIGIWIKLPSSAAGTLIASPAVMGGVLSSSNENAYSLTIHGSAPWSIRYCHDSASANATYTNIFATALANDTWYYIGISRDSTAKTVTMYMAALGDSAVETVGSFSYANNPNGSANGHAAVGNCQGSNSSFDLVPGVCTIEEHYVWSRILSQAEHGTAMQGNPPLDSMVLGCYMGDTPEVDISGNGGSGAVTGTTLVQGHD